MSLLSTLLTMGQQAATVGAPIVPQGQLTPPDSEPLVVKGTPTNYDNSKSVAKVKEALAANPTQIQNRGLYSLLPDSWQQGTMRNFLGHLGDAFLVNSGNKATFAPRLDRQLLGDAMAGFQTNPGVAASRVAGTGVDGAAELAVKMFDQSQNRDLRRDAQDQTELYRQEMTNNRQVANLQRMIPYVGGMFQYVKTPEDYKRSWDRADALAKRINPEFTAADFGLPDPADWRPADTATTGATTSQVMRNSTSNRAIDQRAAAASQASKDRRYSVDRRPSPARNATTATMMNGLMQKQNRGETLSPAEQQFWDKNTKGGKGGGGRSLPAGLEVKGAAPAQGGAAPEQGKKYTPAEAQKLPKGTQFQGTDGNWYIR